MISIGIRRYADVGIPSLKLAYEYDEPYWHKDKKAEAKREAEFEKIGWNIVHITDLQEMVA